MAKEKEEVDKTSLGVLHDLLEADNRNMRERKNKPSYSEILANKENAWKLIGELSDFSDSFDKDGKGRAFCWIDADKITEYFGRFDIVLSPVETNGKVDFGRTGTKISNSLEKLGSDMFFAWRSGEHKFKVYQHYKRATRGK